MAHSHSHAAGIDTALPLNRVASAVVVGLLAAFGIAVIAGALILWPGRQRVDIPLPFQNVSGGAVTTVAGRVLFSGPGYCGSPSAGQVFTSAPATGAPLGARCLEAVIDISAGPNAGAATLLEFGEGPGQPALVAGEHVRLIRVL